LVEEAGTLALAGANGSGIAVRFCFDPELPPVLVDPIQIQQVLINLIRNAVEAMSDEEAQNAVRDEMAHRELVVAAAPTGPETVEVSVADTGPGLAPEVAERLFTAFVSSKPTGMGIGLSISRSIVEAHGGRIWTEPNPGGGTAFRFTLAAAGAAAS
jgi:two-component system sensor kinase FixL